MPECWFFATGRATQKMPQAKSCPASIRFWLIACWRPSALSAADDSLPQPFRDLATVRGTAVDFDGMKPDAVIARLASLSQPGNSFFGSAGEMTAIAMLAKGDKPGAGAMFARIAADKQVPDSIRSRAVQIAGTLGVDASASMPGDPAATPAL